MNQELSILMDNTKIDLLSRANSSFVNTVLFGVPILWDDNLPYKTLCTDGQRIYIDPPFFKGLSSNLRMSALYHEAWHIILMHPLRRKEISNLDMGIWPLAVDQVVNNILYECGLEIGKGWIFDRKFKGMSTEEVYKILLQEKENDPDFDPSNALGDDVLPTPDNVEDIQDVIEEAIIRGYMAAKMNNEDIQGLLGGLPGGIVSFIEAKLNPKMSWTDILKSWCFSSGRWEYTWNEPNKRYMDNYYLPRKQDSNGLAKWAWICDVSGSITDLQMHEFLSEGNYIKQTLLPEKTYVVGFDECIKEVYELDETMEMDKIEFTTGGGTDIDPVLTWINENDIDVAVIFTDGEFYPPTVECNKDIIWLIHSNTEFTVPFGRVIYM